MYNALLEYIPADEHELAEFVQKEIKSLQNKKKVNPQTKQCAEEIKNFLDRCGISDKPELMEITGCTHQRVQAALTYLEMIGFCTVHPKDENHKFVWAEKN